MYIYLICFFTSCLFLMLSEKYKKNKIIHNILVIIALFFPCLLAGMRAETIGTDVQVYLKPMYNCANLAEAFSEYLNMRISALIVLDFEIGFSSLVYVITKIFGNIQFVFFFIELCIILPIYKGLKKIKSFEDNKIWLSMLVFYLMSYNRTLNIMRQYVCIAIIFYATICLLEDETKWKTLKFFALLAIAFLFHRSGLLGIFIYFFYKIINSKKKIKIKFGKFSTSVQNVLVILISIIGIFVVSQTDKLMGILGNVGMDYYSRYIDGNVSFLVSSVVKVLPIAFLFLVSGRQYIKKCYNSYFYILMFIYSIIIEQFTTVDVSAARIAFFFSIFNIVSFSNLSCSNNNKLIKRISIIALIVYMLIYWWYYFVYGGGSETIPYKAFWQ